MQKLVSYKKNNPKDRLVSRKMIPLNQEAPKNRMDQREKNKLKNPQITPQA